jgi:AraC-like DNA-binding protein
VDEAFLATDGQPLEITHHAAQRGGIMRARWLHIRFALFTTVDFASLLTLPGKLDAARGREIGEIIAEMLGGTGGTDEDLAPLARRNELGFRALRVLCEVSTLSEAGRAFLRHADRLAPVLSFIREHVAEPCTIGELAGVAHLSRSQFHTYFREHMKLSPMQYVKSVRLTEARQLLMTTQKPVQEVARLTGFDCPYHFSREFKRHAGVPPVEYRRQHSGLQV